MKRECGSCTECCTVMGVPELNKADYSKCKHECGKCDIYNQRPDSCRQFECGWLLGKLPQKHRPDKSKIVVYTDKSPDRVSVIFMAETVPNASNSKNGKEIVEYLQRYRAPILLREAPAEKESSC